MTSCRLVLALLAVLDAPELQMNILQRTRIYWHFAALATGLAAFPVMLHAADPGRHNVLSPAEEQQGWRLLFDGKTTNGWRGFQKTAFPAHGWAVADGCLKCLGQKGGDLVTTAKFTDFELTWEWRLSPGGNSGVKYFVDEKRADTKGKVYGSAIGHEYQMIDDNNYPEPITAKQHTAGFYDVIPPTHAQPKPVGEFNQSRIVVSGKHVEHWLNGALAVAYQTDSAETAAGIASSKFKNVPGFANKIATPILLQDHNTTVWFRDLKLRPLPAQ
jgi:hypothetical protein